MTPLDAIRSLVETVAQRHGFTAHDLMSPQGKGSRLRPMAHARQEAMWVVMNAYPAMSRVRCGKLFNRDHTTVLHGVRKHEARMAAMR